MSKFIINLFGESCAGKTSLLLKLADMIHSRSRYYLEVADGFTTRDRRMIAWYKIGRKHSGAVCVCTLGDTRDIVKDNIDFFNRHFSPDPTDLKKGETPWRRWKDAARGAGELTDDEVRSLHNPPVGILVTASRKPLGKYNLDLSGFDDVRDVPVRIDSWHNRGNSQKVDSWMFSTVSEPQALLFHVNYILRNAAFKALSTKRNQIVFVSSLSSSISSD